MCSSHRIGVFVWPASLLFLLVLVLLLFISSFDCLSELQDVLPAEDGVPGPVGGSEGRGVGLGFLKEGLISDEMDGREGGFWHPHPIH